MWQTTGLLGTNPEIHALKASCPARVVIAGHRTHSPDAVLLGVFGRRMPDWKSAELTCCVKFRCDYSGPLGKTQFLMTKTEITDRQDAGLLPFWRH